MLVGRDTNSLDAFGNDIACSNSYAVSYYGESSNEATGSSTDAIVAVFFVSFSIVMCFTCGIVGPRLYAYLYSGNYAKASDNGDWGIPNGKPAVLRDEDESDDGIIDRSNTPFTHSSHLAVANSGVSLKKPMPDRADSIRSPFSVESSSAAVV